MNNNIVNTAEAPIQMLVVPEDELIATALIELSDQGFGTLVYFAELAAASRRGPLLVIDRDDQETVARSVRQAGFTVNFHLLISDLGIETDPGGAFNLEDLQLLKDGIQAACTVTKGPTPQFNCPCCG